MVAAKRPTLNDPKLDAIVAAIAEARRLYSGPGGARHVRRAVELACEHCGVPAEPVVLARKMGELF